MIDYDNMGIDPRLPFSWGGGHGSDGRDLFNALQGAKIVAIGAPDCETSLDGGGLIVDFLPSGGETVRRVVFAFTESGMWVEYDSEPPPSPSIP